MSLINNQVISAAKDEEKKTEQQKGKSVIIPISDMQAGLLKVANAAVATESDK